VAEGKIISPPAIIGLLGRYFFTSAHPKRRLKTTAWRSRVAFYAKANCFALNDGLGMR
jgi:uncharacterized membrane protein YdfJ with MMPL/SSD domain